MVILLTTAPLALYTKGEWTNAENSVRINALYLECITQNTLFDFSSHVPQVNVLYVT